MSNPTLDAWHRLLEARNAAGLGDLLTDDAVFHSPILHTPQQGKQLVALYLSVAMMVLGDADFKYVREVVSDSDAALEFTAEIDGIQINGIDLIHWNGEGKIDDFKVMIRPLKAVNLMHALMKQMLSQMGGRG